MLILLAVSAAWVGWRVACATAASLRGVPRRNEDMVFF